MQHALALSAVLKLQMVTLAVAMMDGACSFDTTATLPLCDPGTSQEVDPRPFLPTGLLRLLRTAPPA